MSSNPETGSTQFIQHFCELRARLVKSLICIGIGIAAAFNFYDHIIVFLMGPLWQVMPEQSLVFVALEEAFLVKLKISLWTGLFISAPVWLHQAWNFLGPALYKREKSWLRRFSGLGSLFFFSGAAMAYFIVLPLTIGFFVDQAGPALTPLPAVGAYITLIIKLVLAFGFVFQLPLVLTLLAMTGIVKPGLLRRGRKYACLLIFVAAAVLTPPDVFSQALLAVPMLVLYELGILGAAMVAAKAAKKEQSERVKAPVIQ